MNSSRQLYHKSVKILGKLYREIDEKRIWREDIHIDLNTSGPSVWDQLLTLVKSRVKQANLSIDYSRRLSDAWRLRSM